MVQNSLITPWKFHSPTIFGSKWVGKQTSERSEAHKQSKQCKARKSVSGEWAKERARGPTFTSWFLVVTSRPKARDGQRCPCPALVFWEGCYCLNRAAPRRRPEGTKFCRKQGGSVHLCVHSYPCPSIHERPVPASERHQVQGGCADVRTDAQTYAQIPPVFYRTLSPPVPSGLLPKNLSKRCSTT